MLDDSLVGTCALIVVDVLTCKLDVLAIHSETKVYDCAFSLGLALIEKAKERGFKRVVSKINTNESELYEVFRRLGFKDVLMDNNAIKYVNSPFFDVFMELVLESKSSLEYYI